MSTTTSISVIVPVFQDPDGIRQCLQALAVQTYPARDMEVVVVDNNPIPLLEIDDSYPFKVTLTHCVTPGSYAARNAGALCSHGRILAFTDADCEPQADWISNGINALSSNHRDVIIGGDVRIKSPKKRTAVALYQGICGFHQEENIALNGFSATANIFLRRSTFNSVGLFEEKLLSGGDREWCWRAGKLGIKTVFDPSAIVETYPRTTLSGAIKQARRVTGGRRQLKRTGLAIGKTHALAPRRGIIASFKWIIKHPDLSSTERIRVLIAATTIKIASILEKARLGLGGPAERQ